MDKKLTLRLGRSAMALLAGCTLLGSVPAMPQVGRVPPANVGSGDCDRACLQHLAEQFIAAVIAHDPTKLPLAKNARYSENGVELPIPDGFWFNATGADRYRLYVADPEWGTIGFYARMLENNAPMLVTTRLKVYQGQVTEIETIVAKEFRFRGNGQPGPDVLGETPRPQYLQPVPVKDRRSREELMKIVNTYFTGIENNAGERPPIFSRLCQRLENGTPTSNNPVPPGQERKGGNMSCAEDIAMGYHRNDNRLRNRRILAVDVERQIVMASVYFDHLNDERIRTYKLKTGKTMNVDATSPATLGMHEIFSVDKEGISQVEAIMTTVPYGTRPYFSTGFHMDSEQSVKDGFVEWP